MTANCLECPLWRRTLVPPAGAEHPKLIIVGEAPGRNEALRGRPFIGDSGRILDALLGLVGIGGRDEVYITNAVLCHPPENELPARALDCCAEGLREELKALPPDVPIILMGKSARDALLPMYRGKSVESTRGWHTWEGRRVFCMNHPAIALYQPAKFKTLETDILRVAQVEEAAIHVTYDVARVPAAFRDLVRTIDASPTGRIITFDVETDGTNYLTGRILSIQIGDKPGHAWIIPEEVLYADGLNQATGQRLGLTPRQWVWDLLRQAFTVGHVVYTAHNAKYDQRFLVGQLGLPVRCDMDTLIAHYVLNETGRHGLKVLGQELLGLEDWEKEIGAYRNDWCSIPKDLLYEYGARDVEVTRTLAERFRGELLEQGLWENPFQYPLMRVQPMLLDFELHGFQVSGQQLRKADEEVIGPRLDEVSGKIQEIIVEPIKRRLTDESPMDNDEKQRAILQRILREGLNPASFPQMGAIVYDAFGVPLMQVRTRSKGAKIAGRSTRKEVVEAMLKKAEEHDEEEWSCEELKEFLRLVIEYRHLMHTRTSYARSWQNWILVDGRVHPNFWVWGTETGRLSARDPAIQTVPTGEWGDAPSLAIVDAFGCAEGYSIVYADQSQFELRLAAAISGDEFMITAFKDGEGDFHSAVARAAYGPDFSKGQRAFSKRCTFAWLYGGNVFEIARDALLYPEPVARRFADDWNNRFKGMAAWRESQARTMREQHFVQTIFGRRRRYPFFPDNKVRAEAERAAMNMPIQSTASDLVLLSALEVHDRYKDDDRVHVLCLIHDSILLEVRDDMVEQMKKELTEVMVRVASSYFPTVPFEADSKSGKTWGEINRGGAK